MDASTAKAAEELKKIVEEDDSDHYEESIQSLSNSMILIKRANTDPVVRRRPSSPIPIVEIKPNEKNHHH